MICLNSYSRQVFIYLDILIYISLWIDCLSEIRKIAVCFLWLLLPGDYRVTDEALLAKTTQYDPTSFLWMFSLFLKDLISDFYFSRDEAHISCSFVLLESTLTFWKKHSLIKMFIMNAIQ